MPTPLDVPSVSRRPRQGHGLTWLILILVLGALGAGVWLVHTRIISLPVAVVWFEPARLEFESAPPGAEVRLDGRLLSQRTPARTTVTRDRAQHSLEVSLPGHLPVHQTIYFDRAVELKWSVTLPPKPIGETPETR
jgi:hypothetical protein